MTKIKEDFFPALTGMRALVAYLVFIHHFVNNNFLFGFIPNIFREGQTGVTIFFVLSGFLISYRYSEKITISRKWLFIFIRNRFARIYPMFFILTTAFYINNYFTGNYENLLNYFNSHVNNYLLCVSFLKGFFSDAKFWGVAQAWSLTVEEIFYLLAPIFLLFIRKSPIRILYAFIIVFLLGFFIVFLSNKLDWGYFFENNMFMLTYTFFGRSFEFFAGMYLAYLLKNKNIKTSINSNKYTTFGFLGIIICLSLLYINSFFNTDINFGTQNYLGRIINNILLPVPIIIFFYGLIAENTVVSRILSTKLFQLLGKSSYIFYLIHMGIIHHYITSYLFNNNILVFISLNIASVVLYLYIEKPLNKLIRKIKFSND